MMDPTIVQLRLTNNKIKINANVKRLNKEIYVYSYNLDKNSCW